MKLKQKKSLNKKAIGILECFFLRKDSIINNFKKYQPNIYKNCVSAVSKAKVRDNTYYLNKAIYLQKLPTKVF